MLSQAVNKSVVQYVTVSPGARTMWLQMNLWSCRESVFAVRLSVCSELWFSYSWSVGLSCSCYCWSVSHLQKIAEL